jgi:hypothetical protein
MLGGAVLPLITVQQQPNPGFSLNHCAVVRQCKGGLHAAMMRGLQWCGMRYGGKWGEGHPRTKLLDYTYVGRQPQQHQP